MTKHRCEYDSWTPKDIDRLRKIYVPTDQKTWPYFPITMPLYKGRGPATAKKCDEITFEVWDQFCNSVASYECLCDANEKAMTLNDELLKELKT